MDLVDATTETLPAESNIIFHRELTSTRNYNSSTFGKLRVVAVTEHLVYGSTSLCSLHKDDFPVSVKWPYYVQQPMCPWLYDVLKKYYLRLLALDQQDQPVAMDELRCPHIVVISRALRHNGRGLANEDLVVEELRQYVKSGGPKIGGESLFRCGRVSVVELERVGTVRGQIKKIQNATVLVGARGMGLVYAAFLRNRAGLLALSGREKSAPTSVVKDNYAWYPLRAAKPSVPTVLASCPVVFPKDTSSAFAQKCLKRTINFCDIYCDPRHLVGELERLLTMMHRKIERGPQHAIYADDNLDNYLVVPKSFLR